MLLFITTTVSDSDLVHFSLCSNNAIRAALYHVVISNRDVPVAFSSMLNGIQSQLFSFLLMTLMKYTANGINASNMLVKLITIQVQSLYERIKIKIKENKIRLHINEQEDNSLK